MTPAFVFNSLRRRGRTFRRAKAGNVILTFALSFIPMVAMVGAAVDYSRGNNAKVSMQAAIDATGLMLSKDVSTLNAQQLSLHKLGDGRLSAHCRCYRATPCDLHAGSRARYA